MSRAGFGPFKQTETHCRSRKVVAWWSKPRTCPFKKLYYGWAIEVRYRTMVAFSCNYCVETRLFVLTGDRERLFQSKTCLLLVKNTDMADKRALLLQSVDHVRSQEWCYLPLLLICYTAILQRKWHWSASSTFVDVHTLVYIIYSMELRFICLLYNLLGCSDIDQGA